MRSLINTFKTWVDWWIFIPVSLTLAIASYWFIPAGLKLLRVPTQDMAYTGTAWLYMLFQIICVFMLGLGCSFVVYRFFFRSYHKYMESLEFEADTANLPKPVRVILVIAIPVILFIGFCVICVAVFP